MRTVISSADAQAWLHELTGSSYATMSKTIKLPEARTPDMRYSPAVSRIQFAIVARLLIPLVSKNRRRHLVSVTPTQGAAVGLHDLRAAVVLAIRYLTTEQRNAVALAYNMQVDALARDVRQAAFPASSPR